ncbi:hypothetical protein CAOG_009701 [Capsaspora owczarzaki ATCC 30864]|uniref:Uncharacterized protein n=1 Tax=Capsaspora owczarzaki (strain ATCC 30864) TaxID=595528 RepID=A0A0D2VQ90_CAPO3|nr:hypothetical protein CAOG_009701 [Capsaspora owczarzaki ATCC 30864]
MGNVRRRCMHTWMLEQFNQSAYRKHVKLIGSVLKKVGRANGERAIVQLAQRQNQAVSEVDWRRPRGHGLVNKAHQASMKICHAELMGDPQHWHRRARGHGVPTTVIHVVQHEREDWQARLRKIQDGGSALSLCRLERGLHERSEKPRTAAANGQNARVHMVGCLPGLRQCKGHRRWVLLSI